MWRTLQIVTCILHPPPVRLSDVIQAKIMLCSLADTRQALESQIAAKNLAAVIIQLNDTYLIDAREDGAGIPGLPRVARFVADIRELVNGSLGRDRTLVLHAGDYLSPSLMSCVFHGSQMLDLLAHCDVRFATIGNHEFDVGTDRLGNCLATASFQTIVANLRPPASYTTRSVQPLTLWPRPRPFLAITGLAGEQTRGKALDKGWSVDDPKQCIKSIIERVTVDPAIRALVILTHMGRDEDLELQEFVGKHWPGRGAVYMIAGHDHDIHWAEPQVGRVFVSKSLSNAKSITVIPILRDLLGSLGWPPPELEPPLTSSETAWADEVESQIVQARTGRQRKLLLAGRPDVEGRCCTISDVVRAYRSAVSGAVRREFRKGFERRLRSVYRRFFAMSAEYSVMEGSLAHGVAELAEMHTRNEVAEAFYAVPGKELIAHVTPDSVAENRVRHWQQELQKERPVRGNAILVDFAGPSGGGGTSLDATDDNLRRRSTDFGNFCADAFRRGSNADIGLINSGSFRFDDEIPHTIRLKHLHDVFLYDRPTAAVVVQLSTEEVIAFYEHAIARGGHGAFLQVSESLDDVRNRPTGMLDVALIKHMLKDREDEFRRTLATLRGVSEDTISDKVAEKPVKVGSIIGWIKDGCRSNAIRYSNERRISAGQTRSDRDLSTEHWKLLMTEYDALCERATLSPFERFERLTELPSVTLSSTRPFDRELDRQICDAHVRMINFICSLRVPGDRASVRSAVAPLIQHLDRERIPPEVRSHFVRYLENIVECLEPSRRSVVI
jgi:2',3'-cyclic-nucleotide 2'-phosphodiesterase (5'-nucleotidase family)